MQWNTEEIAYERYLDINNKQQSIWVMLEPDIWDITNHPSGTKAEPDLQKSLTRWHDLNTRWVMAPLARNPEYYYVGVFKGIQFTIFILGSILVVIGKVLIDEVNPLAPNPSAQATTIAHPRGWVTGLCPFDRHEPSRNSTALLPFASRSDDFGRRRRRSRERDHPMSATSRRNRC